MYPWTSDKARIEQQNMRIEMINERERKSKKRPIQHSDAEFSKAKIPNLVRGQKKYLALLATFRIGTLGVFRKLFLQATF